MVTLQNSLNCLNLLKEKLRVETRTFDADLNRQFHETDNVSSARSRSWGTGLGRNIREKVIARKQSMQLLNTVLTSLNYRK